MAAKDTVVDVAVVVVPLLVEVVVLLLDVAVPSVSIIELELNAESADFAYARQRTDRFLDALGDLVSLRQVDIRGELQVQRHADVIAVLKDRDVVRLAHKRLPKRDREHPVAQVESQSPGLDMNDDVAARQRLLDRTLDRVRRGMALDHGATRRHRHHDICEVAPRGFPQPEAVKLDLRGESDDRFAGDLLCRRRGGVHQYLGVLEHEPRRRREDERGDDQGRDRVAVLKPRSDSYQPREDRDRTGEVATEVKRVRTERRRAVLARGPQRDKDSADVDEDRDQDDAEHVPPSG